LKAKSFVGTKTLTINEDPSINHSLRWCHLLRGSSRLSPCFPLVFVHSNFFEIMEYEKFLELKLKKNQVSGFEIHEDYLNKNLFDFQKYIVKKALSVGKFAIFAECGLGKTIMQLEWAHQVSINTNQPVLILCPLAVSAQTIEEGNRFGIQIERLKSDVFGQGIFITNYEQIENIDCSQFAGIVLDESSILKNFAGATKQKIIDSFASTSYKLCCTATPSPNDDMEMCNHAEFLGHGRREEILAMYFTHDGGETAKWRLKGHAKKMFWNFVKSWALMVSNPSDIQFDGSHFILPKLNLIERFIKTPIRQGKLFNDVSISATNFNQELRETMEQRLIEVKDIVTTSNENFIIWIKQNKEADWIMKNIPGAVEVRGDESPEAKEKKLIGFAHNEFRILVTKTKIAMFGLNYQNCHHQIFASLDFSFESLYQAIRRSYRFGQKHEVNIFLITTDTMRNVIQAIQKKQEQFSAMKNYLTQN